MKNNGRVSVSSPGMAELKRGQNLYEYSVLVTSLADEVLAVAQLYRDLEAPEQAIRHFFNRALSRGEGSSRLKA